jgi:hypothetical protein
MQNKRKQFRIQAARERLAKINRTIVTYNVLSFELEKEIRSAQTQLGENTDASGSLVEEVKHRRDNLIQSIGLLKIAKRVLLLELATHLPREKLARAA